MSEGPPGTDPASVTVAVDAMGGDRAPDAIVAGALQAAATLDVDILLVGSEARLRPLVGDAARVALLDASEVVEMHEPATAVRTKRDASVVRCAEAVRDGRAAAMVGAGNTGATMAAALLRFGRLPGVSRPAIAIPVPVAGTQTRQLLVDGGATVDPEPEWLVQWARLAREYARVRLGVDEPTVGLLSNGEEPGKGDALRKDAFARLSSVKGFIGNVEGRDLSRVAADVIVTDGFTGNVALKTLEGAMLGLAGLVFSILDEPEFAAVSEPIKLRLLAAAADLMPDETGGAMLLGVDGVCVISHGSSGERAIVNAVSVAAACARADVVSRLRGVMADAG
ncbi:MAG TPA: phosphate acyltransferase PlsX [Acidimicrobiia bacterium]|nr:phosphate acyltransferase PlsX [Acidimicrobiia bacterium]